MFTARMRRVLISISILGLLAGCTLPRTLPPVLGFLGSATPTPSRTATLTPTPTPTFTATPTSTPTRTYTSTFTSTETPTPNSTESPSPTASPSVTPAWTWTRTRTPTRTASRSPTRTATRTGSATSGTPLPSPTPSSSPTDTATPTPTATDGPTLTPSPSVTGGTLTPSQTFTLAPSPTSTSTPTPSPVPSVTPVPTATRTFTPVPSGCILTHNDGFEQQLISLINNERAIAGLGPLTVNGALTASAGIHSDDMAAHHFMSHTGSDGSTFWQRAVRAGYTGHHGGEIIYGGYGIGSPEAAVRWWMNDAPHRAMILGDLNDFGAGYAYCNGGYFTVDFGHR